jgi:GNAT superfamily N-acetyltransferase
VELRPTTDGDLAAMHATFLTALGDVFRRHAFEPPGRSLEVFSNLQRHARDTGLSYVAEDGGKVVAYGSSITRGGDWFLCSLFVLPEAQGNGVGPALLDAVWGEATRRRTITDAIQPVSNVIYGRRGLIPTTPVLTFAGVPAIEAPPLDEAEADLAAVDLAAYGFDRSVDHAFWSSYARRTTWGDAYSYAVPGGDIGPVGGLTPRAAAAALAAELARADGPVQVRLPGSSRELVEVALRAGLQLLPVPGLLLLSRDLPAPTSLAIAGYTLY